ncbi:hypothetical protein PSPO01_14119 [Paraphaeosphaeria sporulosa]
MTCSILQARINGYNVLTGFYGVLSLYPQSVVFIDKKGLYFIYCITTCFSSFDTHQFVFRYLCTIMCSKGSRQRRRKMA